MSALSHAMREGGSSGIDALEGGLLIVVKNQIVAGLLATELTVFWNAFVGVFRKSELTASGKTFSFHRESNWGAMLSAMLFVVTVETVATHMFVRSLSTTTAWVFTMSSIYAGLWLVGDYHAIRLGRLRMNEHELRFEMGVRGRGVIRYANVADIEKVPGAQTGDLNLGLFSGGQKLRFSLHEPMLVVVAFGLRRKVRALVLNVDSADDFLSNARVKIGLTKARDLGGHRHGSMVP